LQAFGQTLLSLERGGVLKGYFRYSLITRPSRYMVVEQGVEGGLGLIEFIGLSRSRRGQKYTISLAQKIAKREILVSNQCPIEGYLETPVPLRSVLHDLYDVECKRDEKDLKTIGPL
jgi:hypothetical protein